MTMKLLSLGLLVTALIAITKQQDLDAELDDIFTQIEAKLKDRQEVKDLIKEVKDEVTKKPDITARALGMAKAMNLAIPKFQTGRATDIAQGVLAIVAGVAENLPFGQFIAPIASFVAFVIGIVSGPKADNAMRNVIEEVVRQESDHVLSSAATASRQELSAAFNYITSKHSQVLDNEDVTRMVGQIPVTTGVGILALLESRIRDRATTSSADEARQCYKFVLLYAQLASFRDMVLNDLIFQLRRAGDQDEASSYEDTMKSHINNYKNALNFLHHPQPEQAGVVSLYQPPKHSLDSEYIYNFTKLAGIKPIQKLGGSAHILQDVKSPKYHAFLESGGYVRLAQGLVTVFAKVSFVPTSDGFYHLKLKAQWLWIDESDDDTYVSAKPRDSEKPDERGQFVVVKYPNNIITIASRKWPTKFWKEESGTFYVRVREGNTGEDTRFRLRPCEDRGQAGRCFNIK